MPRAGQETITGIAVRASLRLLGLALLTGAVLTTNSSRAESSGAPAYSPDQQARLKAVKTFLLAGEISTWLDTPTPPYDVAITLKIKLEEAGYEVVFDPDEPFDAVLLINYAETPGRVYPPGLDQGTQIQCTVALHHQAVGKVLAHEFETETSWPQPVGSHYWDAVQQLEENPYYYYLGELIRGWLTVQDDSVAVFSRQLKNPPIARSHGGGGTQVSAREAANANARLQAVQELGRLNDSRAIETLWYLVDQPIQRERRAAVGAIGEIGDPAALVRLRQLSQKDTNADFRAAAEAAIAKIQESAGRP